MHDARLFSATTELDDKATLKIVFTCMHSDCRFCPYFCVDLDDLTGPLYSAWSSSSIREVRHPPSVALLPYDALKSTVEHIEQVCLTPTLVATYVSSMPDTLHA